MGDDYFDGIPINSGIDHDKIIPADERTDSAAYSMTLLCKQDKKQLDRIKAILKKLLNEKCR